METNILQFLNQKKKLLIRLICCIIFLFLLVYVFKVLPYRNDYTVTITMKGEDPGKTRLYYSQKYFIDDYSIVSDSSFPERSFVFKYPGKVRVLRLDFDELHKPETQFIISSIKVNNVLFSGKDAYAILSLKNQCTVGLNGDDLIVTVNTEDIADDVYLCFSPLRRYARVVFFGYSFMLYCAVFLLLAVGGCILIWSYCLTWIKDLYPVMIRIKNFFIIIFRRFQTLALQVRKLWFDHANIILIIAFISLSVVFYFYSPNFYLVRMTFADANAGRIKLYYALQTFNEDQTQISDNQSRIKTFLIVDWEPIRFLRFDFDRAVPDGTVFTLESVRINNMKLSNAEIIRRTAAANQAKISTETGKYQILARNYGTDGKILPAATDAYFILDYPKAAYSLNFLGGWRWVFRSIYVALVLALAIWICFVPVKKANRFFVNLYSLSAAGIRLFFRFIIRFYKEIILLSAILLFVCLRVLVYQLPRTMYFLYICEDAQYGLFIGVLAVLAILVRRKIFAVLSFLLLLGMYVIWFVDIYLKIDLNARFNFKESQGWFSHVNSMMPIVKKVVTQKYFLWEALLVLATAVIFIIISREKKRKTFFLFSASGMTVAVLILSLIPPPKSLFDGLHQNVFNYNIMLGAFTKYSPEYLKSVEEFSPEYQCVQGMNLKRNVILLVVESLSSYQSKYFSGLPFDNLKEFDKSLKDASSLSFKYRCSSFNTLTNLFSLLTGYYPLLRPQGKIDYSSDKYYAHSISAEFKREGYHTVMFLPVRFVDNLDVVSEKCDFDTVIDDKDPFFNNAERYIFNGVDDSVAFKRLVNLTEELKSNPKPHFIFMKTTTMHAPYVDPVTQTYSFEATVQFFDRAYKDFMNDLKASGYFDRGGVLVVTGDHRAMVPMGSQEQMRYGVWAIQKVPLVFFGQNLKPVDDKNEYNHVDLHFSLQYLMLNRAWKNRLQKNMFAPEQNQSFTCAFFQQCFNPAEVLLDTSVGEGKIVLNGDKTRIKCPNLTREQTKLIESYLVWVRAR